MNRDPCSIILSGYVALGDAFEIAFDKLEDGVALDAASIQVPCDHDPSWVRLDKTAYDLARARVERRMRDALADRELPAFIRDPLTGHAAELQNREEWGRMSLARLGIETFVDTITNPGPDAGEFPVMVNQKAFDQWIASEMRKEDSNRSSKCRGGRPPAVHWEIVETELRRLMEENGDFMAGDAAWNVQARLEEKLMDFISATFRRDVGMTTLRDHIRPMLGRWREQFAGK